MRLWFRRGRRGRGDGPAALNPPAGEVAGGAGPIHSPAAEARAAEPAAPPAAAEPAAPPTATESEPREAPETAAKAPEEAKEAKSGHRSKHSKKDARAAATPPADPFDLALDRLRTEIPATDEDGSR